MTDSHDDRHETGKGTCASKLGARVAPRPPQSAGREAFEVEIYP